MATALQEFQGNLTKMEDQLKNVLPCNISPKKFIQVVVTAVQNKPNLLDLNRASLFTACKTCAQDGLVPDGREAALVPFKGQVKYMPMVAGVLKTIRNSGELGMIDACVVYEKDEYESWTDEKGPHFKHKKCYTDRGNPILTYAYANTKDRFVYFEEIDENQMNKIEKTSKTTDVWKGPFRDEMKRKSALHRLSKRLPKSSDIEQVMERDNDFYDLETPQEEKSGSDEPVKSSLEKVIEKETDKKEVVDTEFISEESKEITGLIVDIIEKKGPKATKYGCKIGELWYGTFSTTVRDVIIDSKEKKCNVKIIYETSEGKNNILKIDQIWEEEATVAEKDVPI